MSKDNSIVQVISSIANEASGPSYSVVRLSESLINQGLDTTLACLDWGFIGSPPSFLKAFPLSWGPRKLGRSTSMEKWLSQTTASGSVKLIHNHSLWMMPSVHSSRVARKYECPFVFSPRGNFSEWAFNSGSYAKKIFWPLLHKKKVDVATCFHATSNSEYNDIRKFNFQQPVAIIPNGIDIPINKPRSTSSKRTLLFLSRIHPIKGLDNLLRAWKVLFKLYPEWELKIVGPDNRGYLKKMQDMASDLNLQRIEFTGPLFGKAKQDVYQKAELFVLPTHSENFGIAVAEALAAGTPAIVTKGAPWGGLVENNAGWWIEIGIDPLVACLEKALSCSRNDLYLMGQNGRQWMKRDYSWTIIGQQMAEAYQWVINGGTKPGWIIMD